MSLYINIKLVIEVRLREYGSKLIEVIDNGGGVEERNFDGLSKNIVCILLLRFCHH